MGEGDDKMLGGYCPPQILVPKLGSGTRKA